MDDTMTKNAMGLLKIAPIMLLVNGYWMLSNRMIYANYWEYITVD
jgi:integral membrane sensor domain MASE1